MIRTRLDKIKSEFLSFLKNMQELEKLLKSLIQRGWKPWNRKTDFCEYKFWKIRFMKESGEIVGLYTIRSLVSIESWLWQFVCENKMCKNQTNIYRWYKKIWSKEEKTCRGDYYQYRLLESALIPEKELGKFLIDNIK